ncbi:MAG: ion transporter [Polaromonas sp.]|uniref:ion transporter n=1 Tax=Polaromonas sp. TaxID=1869339 RepID=UPI002486D8C4|nr:ion transporter [Polaromonas sp.]MDI1267868.1 ion transporter [Polaromonas sp.]
MNNNFKQRLFHILHKPSRQNPWARYVNYLLAALIVSNALFVAVETVPSIGPIYKPYFLAFEVLSTSIFAIEYLARLWVCVEQDRYSHPVWGRIRYALSSLAILDLIVILTFWSSVDLRFLRVARMVRLLKVLNMAHFEQSLTRVGAALSKRRELLIVSVVMMVLCIYASAAVLYQVEHGAQPKVFSSIPNTLWWAMTTLTTIGYGDMIPITPFGKVCAGLISVFGIGVFALPTAVVTAAIVEAGTTDTRPTTCQHCGKDVYGTETGHLDT